MSNKREIPFTEMFERAQRFAREDAINVEPKYKGLVNDVAIKVLPRMFDWRPLLRSSYIQCSARYNTGSCTITYNTTSVTGTSTSWVSNMTSANGWKIKFTGNDNIYDFDYASATTATITPALSGSTSITAGGYELFRDVYSLHSTFDRFLINGGLEWTRSGLPEVIMECPEDKWKDEFQAITATQIQRMRLLGTEDTSGYKQIQINPPPQTAILLPYDYIKMLLPMTEYTTGTITTLANGGTAVTGSGTSWVSYLQSGYIYYFRIDSDGTGDESVWYKISSAGAATSLTLADAYNGVSIAVGTSKYTISRIPEWPSSFHDAIIYKAVALGIADQDDPLFKYYDNLALQAFNELKVIYKTRTYNKAVAVDMDRR